MIPDRTLTTLEYGKVLAHLEEHTSFSAGRDLARALRPATQPDAVRGLLEQTAEARRLLESRPSTHLGGAHDIGGVVRQAEIGSMLGAGDLLDVASTIGAAARVRTAIVQSEMDLPWLRRQAGRMADAGDLARALEQTFSERGEVLDSASADLRRIRSDLRVAQGRVIDRLNAMISSPETRAALQEPLITLRNGRHVVPVRQEARAKVPGVVHDQSSSGQTVFIEPLAVTEMNNRVKELELAEGREIERILQKLSAAVGARADDLRETVDALASTDLAFAKARYATALHATQPVVNADGHIKLLGARHPLLTGDVVPITITLGDAYRLLVITGPNTGGKTVALKTTGLLTLMAQAGMHIPADDGSGVAVFGKVFADIGDEQSIEQSLSTFSGHIKTIIRVLRDVDDQSLVLLDELGAGTDPAEGAGLARAILTTLLESGARGVITTHYSELKTFAHEVDAVENASVEFDVENLSPTYRLIIGLPGRSQALDIAHRLGMPARVLALARSHVSAGAVRVERLLAQIQAERHELGRLFERSQALHADARALRDRLRAEVTRAGREREDILAEARQQSADVVRELRSGLRELEQEARGPGSRRERNALRERLDVVQEKAMAALEASSGPTAPATGLQPVRGGATVSIPSLGQQGTVISVDGAEAQVQVGAFTMRLPVDTLEVVAAARPESERAVEVHATRETPPMQIDLRGWRADDALRELDQYLHDNYMSGQHTVRIVHGKGTGALRKAIRDELSGHPLVKTLGSEEPKQGGEGVTVVTLAM